MRKAMIKLAAAALCLASCGEGGGASNAMPGQDNALSAPEPGSFVAAMTGLSSVCSAVDEGRASDGGQRYRFTFDMPQGDVVGALIVPWVLRGEVVIDAMVTPAGRVDVATDYRHQNFRRFLSLPAGDPSRGHFGRVASSAPLLLPYADAWSEHLVAGGRYEIEVRSDLGEPCLVVQPASGAVAPRLKVRIFPLPRDRELDRQALSARLEAILASAGVALELSFEDLGPEADGYEMVRDQDDIELVTALAAPPGDSRQALMSVNVIIAEDIAVQGVEIAGFAIVPGAAGFHGHVLESVLVSGADLQGNEADVGYRIAHELFHYLGLRHTTELQHNSQARPAQVMLERLGTSDPLADTPECSNLVTENRACPDAGNLMFPFEPVDALEVLPLISEEQRRTLLRHPLVRTWP